MPHTEAELQAMTPQARFRAKNLNRIRLEARLLYRKRREDAKTDPEAAAWLAADRAKDKAWRDNYGKTYYRKNKEHIRKKNRATYLRLRADPVRWRKKLAREHDGVKAWRIKNPDKFRAGCRRWANTEKGRLSANASKARSRAKHPEILLKSRVRSRIGQALRKGYKKFYNSTQMLGCSYAELKKHLEGLFQPGMTWENRGEWEIDHIRPCASFDLMIPEQQKCCFHYTNLQPLWKHENRAKGAKCL